MEFALNGTLELIPNLRLVSRFKGSSDPSHLIFEIDVGKRRIRHTTTEIEIQLFNAIEDSNSESFHVGSDSFRH